MLPAPAAVTGYHPARNGGTIEYRVLERQHRPAWEFEFGERQITIRSSYSKQHPPKPLLLNFDSLLCHPTLLGLFNPMTPRSGSPLCSISPTMGHFGSPRWPKGWRWVMSPGGTRRLRRMPLCSRAAIRTIVRVTFPPATANRPRIEYKLEVVAIYPPDSRIAGDPRYDGYRRNFLNILQLNPRYRVLANHAASDPCAFTLYEYSAVAVTCRRWPRD